jgi:hypothetical protein
MRRFQCMSVYVAELFTVFGNINKKRYDNLNNKTFLSSESVYSCVL